MTVKQIPSPPPRAALVLSPKGDDFNQPWSGWFRKLFETFNGNLTSGLSVTITTAKLTPGGANGSMTFTNGILTAQTAAT